MNNYIKNSKYIRKTKLIYDILKKINIDKKNIKNNNYNKELKKISKYINDIKLETDRKIKNNVFRKRTANQIITDGFVTGCSDRAIVFIALVRALNIPIRWVETVIGGNKHGFHNGHVFVDINIDGKWYLYDPITGFTKNNKPYLKFNDTTYKILGKGYDQNKIFLKNKNGSYQKDFVKIISINDIIKYINIVGI